MTRSSDPPPSTRAHARPTGETRVSVQALVPPWVRDAIDEAAKAEGISRSGWAGRELERMMRERRGEEK